MPEYLAPGLFVEEIDSGSKPLEGVGTNTAAFVGYAKSGDFNKPTFISNWTQFCQNFGEEENAITTALCKELKMTVSDVRAAKKASRKGWLEYANITITKAINDKKSSLANFQDFLRTYAIPQGGQPYMEDSYLAHAVRGFYDNGGGRAYIVRVARAADMEALSFTLDGAAASDGGSTKAAPAQITAGALLLKAAKAGAGGNDIKVDVEHVGNDDFTLKVSQGSASETFGTKDKPLNLDSVAGAVNGKSKLVEVEVSKTATATRPDAKTFTLTGGLDASSVPAKASGGTALAPAGSPLSNGLASLRPDDFTGEEAQRTGLAGLIPVEGINFIAIPDLMAGLYKRADVPGGGTDLGPEELVIDDKKKQAIIDAQCALVAHCERLGNRMAILDPIPGLNPLEIKNTVLEMPHGCDHGQAAIYYPWIKIADPVNKGYQMFVPPSGHIAGVWARVGTERGVHKAPANESLLGAVALEYDVSKGEQEILNPDGVNCIRAFPGRGIRIWGARTLATIGNPSWKYVNVRRLFNYLEETMERGLQWVVFEPNDEDLWGRVRRTISAFLYTEWREGKLFGSTPDMAYYVKCDAETNPQEMIDLGRLYCEVGVNPVKPAEFVIIRIGQWSGGGSTSES